MTVEQMTFYSKMFLVLMFAFLIAAAAMYFLLEIRKAWQIVVGTKISVPIGRNRNTEEMRRNVKSKELSGDRSGQVSSRVRPKVKRNAAPKRGTLAPEMGAAVSGAETLPLGTETAVLDSGTMPLGTETAILEPETAYLGAETAVSKTGTAVLQSEPELWGPETAVLGPESEMRTTVLEHGETSILGMPDTNETTLLKGSAEGDSMLDIVMDITFVHTSITV